jgi:hypothetical protein
MSKRLEKHKSFIFLLLTTTKVQSRSLLDTITDEQINVLGEIFRNLLQLPLPTGAKTLVHRRKALFNKLANTSVKPGSKYKLIFKHKNQILHTLQTVKKQLLDLLQ